jgi:hypothetical protein
MHLKITIPLILLAAMTACVDDSADTQDTNTPSANVATWKGNAKAAYSIIHDDFCAKPFASSGIVKHWHELTDRGLVAGFSAIVGACEFRPDYYDEMHKMVNAGMEIINHTYTHPSTQGGFDTGLWSDNVDWQHELHDSNTTLHSHGLSDISYFAFPLDIATKPNPAAKLPPALSALDDNALLREVQSMGYKGARGGRPASINPAEMEITLDDLTPFRANFDCFNIHQAGEKRCSKYDGPAVTVLNKYLDDAIRNGGWALRELHEIGENDYWGWLSLQEYRDHLDYVQEKIRTGQIWMDTPTKITLYWASRAYCGKPSLTPEGVLDFDSPTNGAGCIKYSTPLDVIVTMPEANSITAAQEGQTLAVTSLGNHQFMLTVNPTGGATRITDIR